MRHVDLGTRLRGLLNEDRFDEAEELLPEYAQAVTEECITASREQDFRRARDFVRDTLALLKARRAHLARKVTEAERERAYLGRAAPAPTIDYEA